MRYAGSTPFVDYLVGGFYSNEQLRQNTSVRVGSQFTPYLSLLFSSLVNGAPDPTFLQTGLTFPFVGGVNYNSGDGSLDQYRQTDNTYALFTNETFHLTDHLDFNGGLRYTIDGRTSIISIPISAAAADARRPMRPSPFWRASTRKRPRSWLRSTARCACRSSAPATTTSTITRARPSITCRARPSSPTASIRDLLLYASYARGYKAGGFNLDRVTCTVGKEGCTPGSAAVVTPITDTRFGRETNDAFELGEKATLFDRKVLLNATLFYQKYKGFQLNTFNGLVFVVDSMPKVISKGIDTDFVWFASGHLSFQGGLTYADTRYDLNDEQLADLVDKTGFLGGKHSRLSLAPKYSASLSGTYTLDIGSNYKTRFNVGAKYSSRYNTGSDLDPGKTQKGYVLANARIAFGPKSNLWSLEFWSENVLDTNYKQVAFNSGFQNVPTNETGVLDAFLGAPRTFGGTIRVKY